MVRNRQGTERCIMRGALSLSLHPSVPLFLRPSLPLLRVRSLPRARLRALALQMGERNRYVMVVSAALATRSPFFEVSGVGLGSADHGSAVHHPGGDPRANEWFLQSTPIHMLPPGGSICGRLTSDLPLCCLQGGVRTRAVSAECFHGKARCPP